MPENPPVKRQPAYRGAAFAHWANLSLLAVGGLAGLITGDPGYWLATAGLEAAVLWIAPDLPPFRKWVEKGFQRQEMLRERAYYLTQLWGLKAPPEPAGWDRIKALFAEPELRDDLDERIQNRNSLEVQRYLEMRQILKRLKEMVQVPGARITEVELNRFEYVVNGYLRLLIACRPLAQSLARMDEKSLKQEMTTLEGRLKTADAALKAVLQERARLLEGQLERIPRLQATLELFRTRAEAIVYQIHNIHSQVLADPGMNVSGILDEMITRHDLMVDPVGQLESDQAVAEFLSRPEIKAQVEATQGSNENLN